MRIGLDLDGTLISCMEKQIFLMKALLTAHGKRIKMSDYWSCKRRGLNNVQALQQCGIKENISRSLNTQWVEQIELVQWMELDTIIQGVQVFLEKQLKNQNTLHLISARNNKKNSYIQLEKLNLTKYFDTIDFVSNEQGESKKNMFIKNKIDVYIGDTEYDLSQAIEAKVSCYLVSSGMRDKKYLELLHCFSFDSVKNINFE